MWDMFKHYMAGLEPLMFYIFLLYRFLLYAFQYEKQKPIFSDERHFDKTNNIIHFISSKYNYKLANNNNAFYFGIRYVKRLEKEGK